MGLMETLKHWTPVAAGLVFAWLPLKTAVLALTFPGRQELARAFWGERYPDKPMPRFFVLRSTVLTSAMLLVRAAAVGTAVALGVRFLFFLAAWLGGHLAWLTACAWGFGPCGGA